MKTEVLAVGIAAFAATLVATACTSGGPSDSAKPSADYKAQAASVCQKAVADQMKDPDSTKFRDVTVSDPQSAVDMPMADAAGNTTSTKTGGQYWTVTGEVNAANSFGAMVGYRSFTCEAELYQGNPMESGYVNVKDD